MTEEENKNWRRRATEDHHNKKLVQATKEAAKVLRDNNQPGVVETDPASKTVTIRPVTDADGNAITNES